MTLATGTTLENRYRIEELLGQGGMGAVYRAYDTRLQQAVAIKENTMAVPGISPEVVEASRRQFEREALMLARLRHPNLPRVSDHFVTPDGNQYLVMDYIEGDDLAHIIARGGPLLEAQAIAWISQACNALEYLHTQQPPIIHRDIKPQNIKVTPKGVVFLVDFGIAKVGEVTRTMTGALGVTPGFSPPEQYAMTGTDARSDIYSLGATLYALLTAQTPPESVVREFGEKQLVPPRQINNTVSPAVQQAVFKAMETRPTHRPQSMAEFRQMLTTPGRYQDSAPGSALSQTQLMGAADALAGKPAILPEQRTTAIAIRRLVLGGLLLLLLAATSVIVIARSTINRMASPTAAIAVKLPANTPHPAVATATETATNVPLTATPIVVLQTFLTPTVSTPTPAPMTFKAIPLGNIANAALSEDYASPPTGQRTLGSVPFDLNGRAFKSQAQSAPNNTAPTDTTLAVGLSHVERVYILITAGNAFMRWRGQTVGRITLVFDSAPKVEVDLTLGSNLREWHPADNVVSSAPGARQVWQGAITGHPNLTGTLDMLTIEVPADRHNAMLTRIEFHDISVSSVGSLDPALNVSGVTVAHRQGN
jgi:serine/threonine-protein kinase